jgi:hypothetical protein
MERMQSQAKARGLDKATLEDINEEIRAARKERKKKLEGHEGRH